MGYGGSKEEYYNDRTISSEKQSNSVENPENVKSDFISKGMDVFNDAYSYGESNEEKKDRQIKSMANLLSGTYFSEKGLSYDLCESMAIEIVNSYYQNPDTTKILESAREIIEYFSSDDFQINNSGGDKIFNKFISEYPQFSTYDENAKLKYILEIPNSFIGGRQTLIKNDNAIKSWQKGVTEGFRNHGYNEDFIKQSLLILLKVDNRSLGKDALDNFFMKYWDSYENTTDSTENGKNETSGVTNGMNEYLNLSRAILSISSLSSKLKNGHISDEEFIEGISQYEKDEDIVRYYTNKCRSNGDDNALIIFGVLTRQLTGSNFTPSKDIEVNTKKMLVLTAKKHNEEIQEHNDSIKAILHDLDNFSIEDYVAKFEEAHKIAEVRQTYGDIPIILDNKPNTDPTNPSGQEIAYKLLQKNSTALDSYKATSSEIDNTQKSAIKYSAFDTTFNNVFNLSNPIIQKLINQKIDLRSELSNYGIYNYENDYFNSNARNKFVSEKLLNGVLSDDEIDNLSKALMQFPDKVKANYKILCKNFYTDQEGFEKITKAYALGEVIENIKKIFSKEFEKNPNGLGKYMGLELDKEKPANIVGNYLFLKGKISGTETTIKYDLKTGKLFMNSFFNEFSNPPKITIGNTLPTTEIGNLKSFENILDGYNSSFVLQPAKDAEKISDSNTQNPENKSDTQDQTIQMLTENKLLRDLEAIGKIVKSKAEKEQIKNNIISKFLKTFDFLSDNSNPRSIEFMGSSNIFILLESVINAQEDQLNDISNLLKGFTGVLGFERGKNIEYRKESSGTINCIKDEPGIKSIKESVNNFFDNEKQNNKASAHFEGDSSFVSILQKHNCFKKTGKGWEFDINKFKEFYVSLTDSVGASVVLEEAFQGT